MDKLTGDNPSLMECNRSWLMLDIDGWLIPEKYDLYNIEDHPFIIEEVIHAYLCDAFHDVKCFYQFSAQCGTVAGRNNLKVHPCLSG
jgi:hypothetical protein